MTKISFLQRVASEASHDQVRDLVLPVYAGNKGCLGVILHDRLPWLVDISTGKRLDAPFDKPAVGMAFRSVEATEVSGERNQEVAIAYGTSSVKVDRYDIALADWLEPIWFPRAQSVVYSHQGDKLAIGSATGNVGVYDLNAGNRRKELFTINVSKSAIVRMAFSGQGESLVVLTASGAAYSIEAATGKVSDITLRGGDEDEDFDSWAHALHSSARLAAFAGSVYRTTSRCRVWLYSLDNGVRVSIETGHKRYVRRVQFAGNNQLIVIGDQGAEVYDLATRTKSKVSQDSTSLSVAYAAVQAGPCAYVVGTAAPARAA